MNHSISPGRSLLTLSLCPADEHALLLIDDQDDRNKEVADWLEAMLANCELQWVFPEETGDLTNCPMLGILGEATPKKTGPYGCRLCGHWDGKDQYQPILERWGFMNYQMSDPIQELAQNDKVTFWNGSSENPSIHGLAKSAAAGGGFPLESHLEGRALEGGILACATLTKSAAALLRTKS
jgi:hypothetical protein